MPLLALSGIGADVDDPLCAAGGAGRRVHGGGSGNQTKDTDDDTHGLPSRYFLSSSYTAWMAAFTRSFL